MMLARRSVIKGAGLLPLAAVLANPVLARAAAERLAEVAIEAAGKRVRAALAVPERTPAPAILLVHEWWGLNDQIKGVAAEFAKEGYLGLAIDLFGGQVARIPEAARKLTTSVDPATSRRTLAGWIEWLEGHTKGNRKVATLGWCFGGGWSLNASLARPVNATIIYYGNVAKKAAELTPLKGPVLGHFATRDRWINRSMVGGFEKAMDEAGKILEVHWYEADHAFANPTQARYDAEDAALAWRRTLAFLGQHL